MRVVLVMLAGGCYAATPPSGAPCDPATPNCPSGQACIASSTGFECLPEGTMPSFDASGTDSMPVLKPCTSDPDLIVCMSFDAPQLVAPVANEGAIMFGANFMNVSRVVVGGGGAGLFTATSEMAFPADMQLAGIVVFEATLRPDAPIAAMTRVGVIDSDASASGMSLFLFPGTTTTHRVRCTVGSADVFADTTLAIGAWTTLACSCEGGETVVRRDNVVLARGMGCNPGSAAATGLQIGQNSRAAAMMPPNEQFIGAIDRVQLWKRLPAQ